MVCGSRMSQRMISVASSMKGSITALLALGISTMSDSWMLFLPANEEPSNILPSLNMSSSAVCAGMETCCSLPRVSVKRRSMNLTSFSFMVFKTSDADMRELLHELLMYNMYPAASQRNSTKKKETTQRQFACHDTSN